MIEVLLILLSSFHLNGYSLGLHPLTQVRPTLYSIINSIIQKYCSVAFI